MQTERIRIVLIDDGDAIAELLRVNFEIDTRFVLVARGRDGAEALDLVRLAHNQQDPSTHLVRDQPPPWRVGAGRYRNFSTTW